MDFLNTHRGEVMILILAALLLGTLLVLVPQLLRSHLRKSEWMHERNMLSLEKGVPVVHEDDRAKVAGRMAMLVPMVAIITSGTVTCFMVAFSSDQLFTVVLIVWVVSGIVSLASITGGVALIGRLAQLQSGEPDDELPTNPLEHT